MHTIKEDSKFSGLSNSVDIDAFYRLGEDERIDFGLYFKILYGVGFSHLDFCYLVDLFICNNLGLSTGLGFRM